MENHLLEKNYFELFKLHESFEVDIDLLTDHYHDLQRILHPDNYAHETPQHRRLSAQYAAYVNKAFEILKSQLKRAEYLLQIKSMGENSEYEKNVDPEFLEKQLEWRERLVFISENKNSDNELDNLKKEVQQEEDYLYEKLKLCFENADNQNLLIAKDAVQKLKFVSKIKRQIEGDLLPRHPGEGRDTGKTRGARIKD